MKEYLIYYYNYSIIRVLNENGEKTVMELNIKKGYTPKNSSSKYKTAIFETKGLLCPFLR